MMSTDINNRIRVLQRQVKLVKDSLARERERLEKLEEVTMSTLTIKYTRSLWPRRCFLSDKNLFLKKCYVVTRKISGPGTPVYIHHWITKRQYLVLELQGKFERNSYDFWGT